MVSRSRQRENENEREDDWEWSKFVNRPGRPTQMRDLASWQDHLYFKTSIPVEVPAPPPRIKREAQPIPLKKRKPRKSLRKTLLPDKKDPEYQMIAHYFEYFNQPLNYRFGNLWAIRHCEAEYEGQSDPL